MQKLTGLIPNKDDMKSLLPSILRGSANGSLIGGLPGGGAMLTSYVSQTIEKKKKL